MFVSSVVVDCETTAGTRARLKGFTPACGRLFLLLLLESQLAPELGSRDLLQLVILGCFFFLLLCVRPQLAPELGSRDLLQLVVLLLFWVLGFVLFGVVCVGCCLGVCLWVFGFGHNLRSLPTCGWPIFGLS